MSDIDFNKFKKLDDIEHCLTVPQRYIGDMSLTTRNTYTIIDNEVVYKDLTYSLAFLKLFDEIITNSVDHSKRPEGKNLTTVQVSVCDMTGQIQIYDNGGIAVVKHPEYDQWLPDMLLGSLKSGSNFNKDADSVVGGMHGEGASLANIFSTSFQVETADGKKYFSCDYSNNMKTKGEFKISGVTPSTHYTRITYTPDYKRFGLVDLSEHYDLLYRRTVEVAACNPHLKVSFNGQDVMKKSFKDYVQMFNVTDSDLIYFDDNDWKIGLLKSEEGFKHITFVNTTMVYTGGTHIDYIMGLIVDSIRTYIEKKTKQTIKPSDIRNHFFLVADLKICNPSYNSQTKDFLVTPTNKYGYVFNIDEKFIKKIINSSIVKDIIEWAERKKRMEDEQDLAKAQKEAQKASLRDIEKYQSAVEKVNRHKCILFIAEGDSAGKPLKAMRNTKLHGVYLLKGKPINVREKELKRLKDNEELWNLTRVLGLTINKPVERLGEGEWVEIELDGEAIVVNANDIVFDKAGNRIFVKDLM